MEEMKKGEKRGRKKHTFKRCYKATVNRLVSK